MAPAIIPYDHSMHRDGVVSLWTDIFGYEADHNKPELVIAKKLAHNDRLFFVAVDGEVVIGTVMAGYDGHRGWIYAMAVSSGYRQQGIGSRLLSVVEEKLSKMGCMKINLQILDGNESVARFYQSNGYHTEKRISMGKRMVPNIKTPSTR